MKCMTSRRKVFEILLGLTMLTIGCVIYLLFRSKNLNIYQWCVALGLSDTVDYYRHMTALWDVPDFIRFCIPDGLYCAAYLLLMDAIWYKDKRIIKYFILSLVPFITICSEILQYFGLVKGTYDGLDLISYIIPPLTYIGILFINKIMFNNLKFKNL